MGCQLSIRRSLLVSWLKQDACCRGIHNQILYGYHTAVMDQKRHQFAGYKSNTSALLSPRLNHMKPFDRCGNLS